MPHLFQCWAQIAARLDRAPAIALFLDFDGTLARIKPRPGQVWLEGPARQALRNLARCSRFRIWVISGRRQADVCARVGVPGIEYLGLHGWESGASSDLPPETAQSLACAGGWISALVAGAPQVWVENKDQALTVHYRDAAESDAVRVQRLVEGVVASVGGGLQVRLGKCCSEVIPAELGNKGDAVKRLMAPLRGRALPVYVGDDRGDESAFAALADGVTVRVGWGVTQARYRLSNAAEVRELLQKMAHLEANGG
jgi:trehalose 6-phosphate phosphatase